MGLPSISLNRTHLSDFEHAIRKEWLITNGLGGYASSTVSGINTRKYHGILVAAMHPPKDRRVMLEKLDEDIIVGNETHRLGSNEFREAIFPHGFDFIEQFSASPFPTYVYVANEIKLQKTLFMPYRKNCTVALYSLSNRSNHNITTRVYPLVNWRHFHSLTEDPKKSEFTQQNEETTVKLSFTTPTSTLLMTINGGKYVSESNWVQNLYYREEAHRGEKCLDNCYQPGYFETNIDAKTTSEFTVVALADENEGNATQMMKEIPTDTRGIKTFYKRETTRLNNSLIRFYNTHATTCESDWLNWLILALGSFIVSGSDEAQKSVIAGYHWFETWGRDTFISLPGLMLTTGKFEDARKILLSFAKNCKKGLIPNFLPDRNEPSTYNTVDATLWYINAVLQFLKYTGDFEFVKNHLWRTLVGIIQNHADGTSFNIRTDADGLLNHGPQLTWMDAAINGEPVTPRAGKAVEIQALWYNSLRTMELLADRFGESCEEARYADLAQQASRSFRKRFWNLNRRCLYDFVTNDYNDSSLRPNQTLAVSLDFNMLRNEQNREIVDAVQQELLTPAGLRTLAPSDTRYTGTYSGNRISRDRAYHNGTVWPWLLGPLTTAYLKVNGNGDLQREYAFEAFLKSILTSQISEAGIGTISEIFDGNPPYAPRGCIAQAWSVAEPFRAYVEDIMQCRPRYERKVMHNSL